MSKLRQDLSNEASAAATGSKPAPRAKLALLAGALIGSAMLCVQGLYLESRAESLSTSRLSIADGQKLLSSGASPKVLLAGAEALDLDEPGAAALAVSLTRASLTQQPKQPFAWAELAYFQTRLKGGVDETALYAFQRSIAQCGYCDRDLLRWRLLFTIDNWNALPERERLDAFRGAEFLRWWHIDGAFLAEARERATARGIDFRDYQRRVVSDVRSHEVTGRR